MESYTTAAVMAPPVTPMVEAPTILLAWSVPNRRWRVVEALERAGYGVREVFDGFDLLDELTSISLWFPSPAGSGYELVLADAWLPGCPAVEVLEELRLIDQRTPFTVMEADRLSPEAREQVAQLGGALCDDALELTDHLNERLPSLSWRSR